MESLAEHLIKSGLILEKEWSVNIHIYRSTNYSDVVAELKKVSSHPELEVNKYLKEE